MSDWDLLGVPRNASKEQVKSAYRTLCLKHHPDLFPANQRLQAEAQFRTISEAYNRLHSGRGRVQQPHSVGTPYRQPYRWSRTPPKRFTNGMVASALCVPLVLTGIYFASTGERTPDGFGRPHGMLQPPVNPFLAEAWKPREHRSALFRRQGIGSGSVPGNAAEGSGAPSKQ